MNSVPQLKPRSDIHLTRKIYHFTGIIIIAILYHNMSRPFALQVLTIFSALMIAVEMTRQRSARMNQILVRLFQPVMRDSEKHGITGMTFVVVGVLLIVLFFPKNVVTLALLFLAIADPIASYFGIRYGKDRLFGRKSLQGSLAAFVACTVVATAYFFSHNLMTDRILIVSVLAGVSGALAEATPVGKLDDNFVMPVVSSGLLWIIYMLFGGL
jgi:diacylglycerol kinase (CTP)